MAILQEMLSAADYAEEMAYYQIEPWGPQRDNLHAGIIAATVCNMLSAKESRQAKPGDFLLRFGNEQEQLSQAEQMKRFTLMVGGRVI